MKVAFTPGTVVDIKTTAKVYRYKAGQIVRYDLEGFYRVAVDSRELIVHEDDMRVSSVVPLNARVKTNPVLEERTFPLPRRSNEAGIVVGESPQHGWSFVVQHEDGARCLYNPDEVAVLCGCTAVGIVVNGTPAACDLIEHHSSTMHTTVVGGQRCTWGPVSTRKNALKSLAVPPPPETDPAMSSPGLEEAIH